MAKITVAEVLEMVQACACPSYQDWEGRTIQNHKALNHSGVMILDALNGEVESVATGTTRHNVGFDAQRHDGQDAIVTAILRHFDRWPTTTFSVRDLGTGAANNGG